MSNNCANKISGDAESKKFALKTKDPESLNFKAFIIQSL